MHAAAVGSLAVGPRRITANGIDFAYLEAGSSDGPLALCLHGFPDHALAFEELLAELADAGFHAVAPWMRGYAPTGLAPDGNYQSASLALDAIALADALAGDRDAVLIGHDWGALATYLASVTAPQRFRRIVTMAVPHTGVLFAHMTTPAQLKRSWYMYFFQLPMAEAVVPLDDFALIDTLWRDWSPGYEPDPAYMRALKDMLAAPGVTAAALAYYRAILGATPADPALDAVQAKLTDPIPVPALYLHGADDGCIGGGIAVVESEMKPFFPAGLELVLVPGTGHFLHLEEPDVVNHRIVTFLCET